MPPRGAGQMRLTDELARSLTVEVPPHTCGSAWSASSFSRTILACHRPQVVEGSRVGARLPEGQGRGVKQESTAPRRGGAVAWCCSRCHLHGGLFLQAVQVVGGPLGVSCGRKNRVLVLLQDLQPVAQIGGVILANLGCEPQVCAEKGGAQLGDKLFKRISTVSEPLPRACALGNVGRSLRKGS